MKTFEIISSGKSLLAYIIRGAHRPRQTEFLSSKKDTFQAGFVVYPAGGKVTPHEHLPMKRRITATAELDIVKKGRCAITFYAKQKPIARRILGKGDAVITLAGGHSFEMLSATELFIVKQGPYSGVREKKRF